MAGRIRTLVTVAVLGLMLSHQASAGVVCETIGKCWDKAIGKAVKAHEKAQAHLKESLHHKGLAAKLKSARHAGSCQNCR